MTISQKGEYFATSDTGGSLINGNNIPTPSIGYEVKATFRVASAYPGGYFTIYLEATSDALHGANPQGSYYAIDFQYTGTSFNVAVYKRVNSVITLLQSSSVAVSPYTTGVRFRAVRRRNGGIHVLDESGNYFIWITSETSLTDGYPGVGARQIPDKGDNTGAHSVYGVQLGPGDSIGPYAVDPYQVTSTYTGGCLNINWAPAADDADGIGVGFYHIFRNDTWVGSPKTTTLSDCGVTAGQSYTYRFYVVDQHVNFSAPTDVTLSAGASPPPGVPHFVAPDPIQPGVRPLGAYWGSSPEQIDVRSGNLNFTVPLFKAMGRGGWGVQFALSYNSQLWFMEGSAQTKLGADVGYGFGWKLLAGAMTPIWSGSTLLYHLFTDSTGAEYKLDVNESGVWRTREGVYLRYDSNTGRLNFPDGSYWILSSVAASGEADAGTRYPTLMRDTNGNEIRLSYAQGSGGSTTNTSARITSIEDVRAIMLGGSGPYRTYSFTYNTDTIPHLTAITSHVLGAENWTTGYLANQALYTPFSPSQSAGTAHLLTTLAGGPTGATQTLEYAGSSGELSRVYLPLGGSLRWTYRTALYSNSRQAREVQYRYLRPSSTASETYVTFSHDDSGDSGRTFTIGPRSRTTWRPTRTSGTSAWRPTSPTAC